MDKDQRVATAQSDHFRADNGLAKCCRRGQYAELEWLKRGYSGGLFLVQRALEFNLDPRSGGAIVGQTHLDAVRRQQLGALRRGNLAAVRRGEDGARRRR